jgi:NAD dependent epimerase/dehydratase family enzyme
VNAVGPAPLTSADYAKVLGRVLSRPAIAPLPAFVLRTMFGELADGAILASQRVLPKRLEAAGFAFLHRELEPALRFTLGL